MSARVRVGLVIPAVAALVTLAAPVRAQLVVADVRVASGPVAGRIIVGNHAVHQVVYRHGHPVRVVNRHAPVVVVRRVAAVPRGHAHGYWTHRGYRRVVLYAAGGRFYDRWYRGVPGLREVVVYERQGRYYLPDFDGRYARYDRDEHRDRYDRRDWYDGDRDDWYDDRDDDRSGRQGDRSRTR